MRARLARLGTAVALHLALCSGCRHGIVRSPRDATDPYAGQSPDHPPTLKVLTWNIWMMPPWTFQSPRNSDRSAAIASEILDRDVDILCFEKAFDGGARRVLVEELGDKYPYQYGPANSSFSLKINSGVWILSRIRLIELHEIQFRRCAGIECFSRKGAILLAGAVGGHRFQLLATHLQGEEGPDYTEAHQLVRNAQVAQIRDELVEPYGEPGVPLILAGDFCTPRFEDARLSDQTEGYLFLLRTLGADNGDAYRITLDDDRARNDLGIVNK